MKGRESAETSQHKSIGRSWGGGGGGGGGDREVESSPLTEDTRSFNQYRSATVERAATPARRSWSRVEPPFSRREPRRDTSRRPPVHPGQHQSRGAGRTMSYDPRTLPRSYKKSGRERLAAVRAPTENQGDTMTTSLQKQRRKNEARIGKGQGRPPGRVQLMIPSGTRLQPAQHVLEGLQRHSKCATARTQGRGPRSRPRPGPGTFHPDP